MSHNKDIKFLHEVTGEPYAVCRRKMKAAHWDHYRLHISGDLGELIAYNFTNMRYETFSDFTDNPYYFEEKIQCHSRDLYVYDKDAAREELKNAVKNRNGNLMKDGARREKKLSKKRSMIFLKTLAIEEG